MDIQIIASRYVGLNKSGDFKYMIDQNINEDALYIFNDNIEHFNKKSYIKGKGNAIIRYYNQFNTNLKKPHSIGIPTGSLKYGGFTSLDDDTKLIIDESFDRIIDVLNKHNFNTIYYSTNNKSGILGTSIFRVNVDVIKYITNKLHELSSNPIIIEMNSKSNTNVCAY